MTDFQTKAAVVVFEFENRIQSGEFDGTPEGNNASNSLRRIIETALAAAYEQGKRDEREACATFSKNWLEDWGMDLQSTCDDYRDAVKSGRFAGFDIPAETAKSFACQFKERADAVYDCGEGLAAAIRKRGEA